MSKTDIIRGKKEVAEIERELNELIHEYELFFQGHERIEPLKKRQKIKRDILNLQNLRINNPIIKQKVANLTHRFALFQRKWDNIWLQIEKGTFKIDRYKMKIHKKLREKKKEETVNETETLEVENKVVRNSVSKKSYDKLLNKYELTQKLLGINKKLNKELLAKKLEKEAERLKKKYKVKDIDFKVTVKNGKATIKPVLKK